MRHIVSVMCEYVEAEQVDYLITADLDLLCRGLADTDCCASLKTAALGCCVAPSGTSPAKAIPGQPGIRRPAAERACQTHARGEISMSAPFAQQVAIDTPKPKRAVLYLRVSTEEQADTDYNAEGYSPEPEVKRQLIQAAFDKLWVIDAEIAGADLKPGYVTLLDEELVAELERVAREQDEAHQAVDVTSHDAIDELDSGTTYFREAGDSSGFVEHA